MHVTETSSAIGYRRVGWISEKCAGMYGFRSSKTNKLLPYLSGYRYTTLLYTHTVNTADFSCQEGYMIRVGELLVLLGI